MQKLLLNASILMPVFSESKDTCDSSMKLRILLSLLSIYPENPCLLSALSSNFSECYKNDIPGFIKSILPHVGSTKPLKKWLQSSDEFKEALVSQLEHTESEEFVSSILIRFTVPLKMDSLTQSVVSILKKRIQDVRSSFYQIYSAAGKMVSHFDFILFLCFKCSLNPEGDFKIVSVVARVLLKPTLTPSIRLNPLFEELWILWRDFNCCQASQDFLGLEKDCIERVALRLVFSNTKFLHAFEKYRLISSFKIFRK